MSNNPFFIYNMKIRDLSSDSFTVVTYLYARDVYLDISKNKKMTQATFLPYRMEKSAEKLYSSIPSLDQKVDSQLASHPS